MADEEQTINARIRFGVDKDSLEDVAKGGDELKKQVDQIAKNTNNMAFGFNNAKVAAKGLMGLARGGKLIGSLIGNEDLVKVSGMIQKVGSLTMQFSRLKASLDKMPKGVTKALGGAVAGFAGFELGKAGYDAIFGKAQGTSANETLDRLGKIIAAGFNVESLRVQATNAYIAAQEQKEFTTFQDQLAGKDTDSILGKLGMYTGPTDLEGLLKAKKQTEAYIEKNPPLAPGTNEALKASGQLMRVDYGLIAKVMLTGINEAISKAQAGQQVESRKSGVGAFGDYQKAQEDALKTSNDVKADIEKRFNDNEADRLQDFSEQKAAIIMSSQEWEKNALVSLNKSKLEIAISGIKVEAWAEKDYYEQRSQMAASYGVQTARAEEDHQRSMLRMQQSHNRALGKLADDRDALGIEDENDSYEIERKNAEEDYGVSAGRTSEDYALQLQEMEKSFADQRAQRAEDRAEQLAQLDANFEEQQIARNEADKKELAEVTTNNFLRYQASKKARDEEVRRLEDGYKDQLAQLDSAFADKRKSLGMWYTGEEEAQAIHLKNLGDQFDAWFVARTASFVVTPPGGIGEYHVPSHAVGGYQDYTGLTNMHAGEFVLNAQTTHAMEQIVGGRLNQDNILGGRGPITLSMGNINIMQPNATPGQIQDIVHRELIAVAEAVRR